MVSAFATVTLLLITACSSDTVQSLPGPIELDGSTSHGFDPPLRTSGLFHQICFALPSGYAVNENFRGVVTPSGETFTIRVRMEAQSGRAFEFNRLSSLRQPGTELACLNSPDLIGRQSETLSDVEVLSSSAWAKPEVRWLSVEKLQGVLAV